MNNSSIAGRLPYSSFLLLSFSSLSLGSLSDLWSSTPPLVRALWIACKHRDNIRNEGVISIELWVSSYLKETRIRTNYIRTWIKGTVNLILITTDTSSRVYHKNRHVGRIVIIDLKPSEIPPKKGSCQSPEGGPGFPNGAPCFPKGYLPGFLNGVPLTVAFKSVSKKTLYAFRILIFQ